MNARRLAVAVLAGIAIPLVALWLSVGWRPPTQDEVLWSDLSWYFVPTFAVLHRSLADGFLPLWNPWQLAGWPFLAAFQTQVLYAPAWAVAWLPPPVAVAAYNALHFAWAFVGVALFASRVGLGTAASLAGGVAYTLSGPLVTAFFTHSTSLAVMSWLPWCACALVALVQGGGARAVAVFAAALAGALLAGAPEHFFYLLGGLGVVLAWQASGVAAAALPGALARLAAACVAAALLAAALLAAAQILPTVELMGTAVRGAGGFDRTDIASFAVDATTLAKAVAGVGGGAGRVSGLLVPLAVAALASRRTRRAATFLVVAGLLVLDHLRGDGGFVFPLLYDWLPFFRAFRVHLRAEFVWTFVAALTMALGVDAFDRRFAGSGRTGRAAVALVVALLFVELGARHLRDRCFVPLATVGPGGVALAPDLSPLLRALAGPDRVFLHYGAPADGLEHKFGQLHGVKQVGDYDALLPARYARLFLVPDGTLWMGRIGFRSRSKTTAGRSVVLPGVDRAPLDLLSARYYLSRAGTATPWIEDFAAASATPHGGYSVVERAAARPRAYVVHDTVAVADDAAALAMLRSPAFDASRSAVVVGAKPALEPLPQGAAERAQLTVDEPNRVVVDAACASRCLLVLTDLDFPGWQVAVDGAPAPVRTANYLVRGVVLEAGRHEVVFAYRPVPAALGAGISLLAAAGLLVAAARERSRASA